MFIKQLSVFIENQEGRLEEVLDVLKQDVRQDLMWNICMLCLIRIMKLLLFVKFPMQMRQQPC